MSHILIKNFDPLKLERLEILNENGEIVNASLDPKLTKDELLHIYKTMSLGRVADIRAVQYQRQGRMLTYAPNIGQEGAQVGAMSALKKEDWLVPGFRELNMKLYKGVPLEDIYLYWYGNEMGSKYPKETRVLPTAVIIGSQIQIGAGIAMASKIQNKAEVTITVIGDGGSSHGDFNEGMNFAGAFDAPLIILVQNNQYAISTPRELQTKAKTIAQKAIAAGIKAIQVDGNDVFAMHKAVKEARKHALKEGPVLIEAVTYRIGAHTTSDDPSLYREDEEVEYWKKRDPILRLRKFLENKGWWDEKQEEALDKENNDFVQKTFAKVEETGLVPLEEIFDYTYEEKTPNLQEQYEYYKAFLEGGKS